MDARIGIRELPQVRLRHRHRDLPYFAMPPLGRDAREEQSYAR
jgi:hypothetical protein